MIIVFVIAIAQFMMLVAAYWKPSEKKWDTICNEVRFSFWSLVFINCLLAPIGPHIANAWAYVEGTIFVLAAFLQGAMWLIALGIRKLSDERE
jgi:hypothetical protein